MFVFVVFLHRQIPADCLLWNILTRLFQSLQYINQKIAHNIIKCFDNNETQNIFWLTANKVPLL